MVAKKGIQEAQLKIEEALCAEFEQRSTSSKVSVFETEWGHLRALIADESFRGLGPVDRQERVWSVLRKRVDDAFLVHLAGVHPMDPDEYDRSVAEVKGD
ncbi:MAG: hypothetical protein IID35_06550 [Planctomycetes bacterium]|nr:hypothetical protein [Planctomycetota bacterium]